MDPRELLKKLTKEARALAIKAELSDEEAARLVAIMGEDGSGTDPACEFAKVRARVKALDAFEAAEAARADGDEPADADEPDEDALAQRVAEKLQPQLKGLIHREAPALLRGGRGEQAISEETPFSDAVKALAKGQFKSVHIPLYPMPKDSPRYKALGEGIDHAGGYLVPMERSNQMIALLRARTAVRAAGATVVPMASDSLMIPRQTGGATAYWVGENQQIQDSDQTFGQVELHAKKLAALTMLSSELYADSDPAIEAIVQADLARVLALEEDIQYLRGTGIGNTPTGLENIAGVGGTTLGQAGAGATPTFDDFADADYALDAANVPTEGRAIIAHPRLKNTFRKVVDLQGRYIWSDPATPGDPPTVWGIPLFFTTAIPINLNIGGTATHTNVYYGAWGEALIGQRKTLELRASDVAGNAFEFDQVFIRAIMRVDFNVRHAEAFYVMRGVRP